MFVKDVRAMPKSAVLHSKRNERLIANDLAVAARKRDFEKVETKIQRTLNKLDRSKNVTFIGKETFIYQQKNPVPKRIKSFKKYT